MSSRAVFVVATAALVTLLVAAGPGAARTQSARVAAEASLAEAQALFGGNLPPTHSATLVLRDLAVRLPDLDPADQTAALALLARPTDGTADPSDQGYTVAEAPPVCTEHFCIHYVTSTLDAPPLADADGNGLPDQVDLTASVLGEVWAKEIDEYGYRAPKADGTSPNHGPDDRLDVYLADVGGDSLYGYAATDDPAVLQDRPERWDASAYLVLDNDFSPSQFDKGAQGADALRVTAAHEFFHTVQFGYDVLEDGWLVEGTAVWMEDQVYDDINDNYQYLGTSALKSPWIPLDLAITDFTSDYSGYQYGAFVFWRYLSEVLGTPDVVRRVWELADGSPGAPDQYSLQATDSALHEFRTSFRSAFAQFAVANADPATAYEEGSAYPTPVVAKVGRLSRGRPASAGSPHLDHLSSWYGVFRPSSAQRATRMRLSLDLPPLAQGSEASVIVTLRSGKRRIEAVSLDRRGDATRIVPFAADRVASVELVLTNGSERYACWIGSPLSCQGEALDDSLAFRYGLRLLDS
jgi:hypothetical protein